MAHDVLKRPTAGSAVTFDLWNTLVSLGSRDERTYVRQRHRLAVESLEEGAPLPTSDGGRNPLTASEAISRVSVWAHRLASKGIAISPSLQLTSAGQMIGRAPDIATYLHKFEGLVRTIPLKAAPGATEVLDQLRKAGYRIGIVSNTIGEPGEFLIPVCRRLGIAERVDFFAFSDKLPWTKPSPEIFQYALSHLGAKGGACLHVGDDISDVVGSRRAGYGMVVFLPSVRGVRVLSEAVRTALSDGKDVDTAGLKVSVRKLASSVGQLRDRLRSHILADRVLNRLGDLPSVAIDALPGLSSR
jgi:HAD superfamily hydrolase (TIGR01549 family)